MEKYNEQMLPKRARSQRQAVGKALEFVVLALDGVKDCKACGDGRSIRGQGRAA